MFGELCSADKESKEENGILEGYGLLRQSNSPLFFCVGSI